MKTIFKPICLDIMVLMLVVAYFLSGWLAESDRVDYIAHAGGAIDGYVYTNSLEAVERSIALGARYIELDLMKTSDGELVAAHDWGTYARQTGLPVSDLKPPSYETFAGSRIYGRYTPMTHALIDSVFKANKHLTLVTDKICDVGLIDRYFHDFRDRIMVECFSPSQLDECQRLGYTPMRSYFNFSPGGVNVLGSGSLRYVFQHFIPTGFAFFANNEISKADADSIFRADSRIRYVYVDLFE